MEDKKEVSILVADDDHDDQDFLKLAFAGSQYADKLSFVSNGNELMSFLGGFKQTSAGMPRVILLDLNMPLCDGYEALKKIKADPEFNEISVAILTSSTRPGDRDVCQSLGCDNFFEKPLNLSGYELLVRNITAWIGGTHRY